MGAAFGVRSVPRLCVGTFTRAGHGGLSNARWVGTFDQPEAVIDAVRQVVNDVRRTRP